MSRTLFSLLLVFPTFASANLVAVTNFTAKGQCYEVTHTGDQYGSQVKPENGCTAKTPKAVMQKDGNYKVVVNSEFSFLIRASDLKK